MANCGVSDETNVFIDDAADHCAPGCLNGFKQTYDSATSAVSNDGARCSAIYQQLIHGNGEVTNTLAGGMVDSIVDSRCHADYSQFAHRFTA